MIKKTIALFAVLAFASFSSFALAGNCGDKDKECDRDKSEASTPAVFEVAGSGCGGSCGGKGNKDGDKS